MFYIYYLLFFVFILFILWWWAKKQYPWLPTNIRYVASTLSIDVTETTSSLEHIENSPALDLEKLVEFERDIIQTALNSQLEDSLDVLGWGEVSVAVRYEGLALKRLSASFPSKEMTIAYTKAVKEYVEHLNSVLGVETIPTAIQSITTTNTVKEGSKQDEECIVVLCQHIVSSKQLLTNWLPTASIKDGVKVWKMILGHIQRVNGVIGLDAQVSNWALKDVDNLDAGLLYFDISTPFDKESTESKVERFDFTSVLTAVLPPVVRHLVVALLIRSILDKYYVPREIAKDCVANLLKEKLDRFVDPFLAVVEEEEPDWVLTYNEVVNYYKQDARDWTLIQSIRAMHKTFVTKILKGRYQFLIPGNIDR